MCMCVYIIVIKSCWKHGDPWQSLSLSFVDFSKIFDSIHGGKNKQIQLRSHQRNRYYNNDALQNTKIIVRSVDGDTDLFDIVAVAF